jgi:hypothetical protein
MSDKATTINDLERAHDQFRSPLEHLDDAAFSETWLGEWNLSQLLAHMAGWYTEMTGAIARAGRGERPVPEGVDYSNSDEWNAKFAKTAHAGKAALKTYDSAYEGYVAAARALPENLYGTDPEKGRPLIGNRLLQASGIGHFEEHQAQLDGWLRSRAK